MLVMALLRLLGSPFTRTPRIALFVGEEPLDVYARHCNWQLRAAEIEGAPEDYDALDYGRELLCEKNPDEDWSALPV